MLVENWFNILHDVRGLYLFNSIISVCGFNCKGSHKSFGSSFIWIWSEKGHQCIRPHRAELLAAVNMCDLCPFLKRGNVHIPFSFGNRCECVGCLARKTMKMKSSVKVGCSKPILGWIDKDCKIVFSREAICTYELVHALQPRDWLT